MITKKEISNEIAYLNKVLNGFGEEQKEWWIYRELKERLAVLKALKKNENN